MPTAHGRRASPPRSPSTKLRPAEPRSRLLLFYQRMWPLEIGRRHAPTPRPPRSLVVWLSLAWSPPLGHSLILTDPPATIQPTLPQGQLAPRRVGLPCDARALFGAVYSILQPAASLHFPNSRTSWRSTGDVGSGRSRPWTAHSELQKKAP